MASVSLLPSSLSPRSSPKSNLRNPASFSSSNVSVKLLLPRGLSSLSSCKKYFAGTGASKYSPRVTKESKQPPISAMASGADSCVLAKEISGKVVIVGGGLGGLAAALALQRKGISVQVFEKNPAIMGGEGTLISIFPNGLRALSLVDPDLVPKIIESGVPNPISPFYSPDGKFLQNLEFTSQMESRYGLPMVAIRWREVLDIFNRSLSLSPSSIHTGYELVGLEQDDEKVTAKFLKDGEEKIVETPLLIGADGIRSKVREIVVRGERGGEGEGEAAGEKSFIRDNGRCVWRAIIPFDRCPHPFIKKGHIVTVIGEGRTFLVGDSGKGSLFLGYTVLDSVRSGTDPKTVRSKTGEEAKELLRNLFEGWELALYVLENVKGEEILERRVLDIEVLEKWVYGRVAILGDAAHAVTPSAGQGANLAFEDALELAAQLASRHSLSDALESYEEIRVPRSQNIATQSLSYIKRTYKEKLPPLEYKTEAGEMYDYIFEYQGSSA